MVSGGVGEEREGVFCREIEGAGEEREGVFCRENEGVDS